MKLKVHGRKAQKAPTKAERLINAERAAAAAHHRLGALERRVEMRELQITMLMNAILDHGAVPRDVLEEHAERLGLELRTTGEPDSDPDDEGEAGGGA